MANKKKNKRTNNDLQNTTHKTKDHVTRIPLANVSSETLTTGRLLLSGTISPPAEVSPQW